MKHTSTFLRAFHGLASNTNSYDFRSCSGLSLKQGRATQRRPRPSGVRMQADSWKHSRLCRQATPNHRGLGAFLGSKLGSGLWCGLNTCMKAMEIGHCFQPDPKWSGLMMSRLTGGNDPAFGCRALACALVVPALHLPRGGADKDRNSITIGSRMDQKWIAGTNRPRSALHAT